MARDATRIVQYPAYDYFDDAETCASPGFFWNAVLGLAADDPICITAEMAIAKADPFALSSRIHECNARDSVRFDFTFRDFSGSMVCRRLVRNERIRTSVEGLFAFAD